MRRYALLVSTILLTACGSSTQLVSTWKDADTTRLDCSRTLVMFPSKNATMRAVAEDGLAARIPNGVAARTVLDSSTTRDVEALKRQVKEEGFDCAVVVRFVSLDSEISYTPGRTYTVPVGYGGFYGYYGTAWTHVYEPGYETETRTLILDTNIYDVPGDKLVWAARSRTVNPDQAESVVAELVDEAAAAMRKQGLID